MRLRTWGFLLGSVVGTLGVYNFTYAQTQSTDCAETARSQESQYVNVVLEQVQKMNPPYTLTIFTDKDLKTALRYHQQYCCQEEVSEDSCQGKLDGTHYFPESPFLFDHLVYVGMRKFNGIQEHCDQLGIDCTTRDGKVLLTERREESQKIAEETDGSPPSQLYELFKKYWGDASDFATAEGKTRIANAYFTMCNEAIQIRKATKTTLSDGVNQEDAWLVGCRALVQRRYSEEIMYVQSLMVDKGVKYLYDNMRAYLMTYFVDNRMNAFVDKFGKLDACFNMVLKYVTRTSCCVD